MPDRLTITFAYSPTEHAEALSEVGAGRKLRWRMRLLGYAAGGLGLLGAGLGALTDLPVSLTLKDGIAWLALSAFWVWAAPALLTAIEGRQLRREASQHSREVDKLTFAAEGFSPSIKWENPIPWSFVDRVVETERYLLIYHGYSTEPFHIPKHALSPSDKERLSAILHANLKSGLLPIQLLSRAT